ncbi:MAG: O-antigen ligase family protein [Ferrovum sp.]|nr:O-antigen ligase family protein [Ferrovum sp.]NDU88182.1 O-antigen ligase family protein [Ferrovum sp.]
MTLPALGRAVRFCTYGMMASLPFAVGGVNVFGTLIILLALLSREWWSVFPRLMRNPMVLICIAMLLLVWLGTFRTAGPHQEALNVLNRYHKLLFIPLLIPFFQQLKHRMMALNVLLGALLFNVVISWTEFFGWTHVSDQAYLGTATAPGDSVFHQHITQGLLFCVSMVVGSALAWFEKTRGRKIYYWGAVLLAASNVAWVMVGKTGKAMLPLLALWLLGEWWVSQKREKKRAEAFVHTSPNASLGSVTRSKWMFAGLALLVLGATTWSALTPSTMLGTAFQEVVKSRATGQDNSQGERVEFWHKGLILISHESWLGYGTGSVLTLTRKLAETAQTPVGHLATTNLHDEYLMWAVQFGLPGALIILLFFFVYWRGGKQAGMAGMALRGAVMIFSFGCLYNSFLVDFAEGYSMVLLAGVLLPL